MFALGRAVKKKVGDKEYTFSRLERRIIEAWRDWIAEREGNPFETAKELLPVLDAADARELIADAKSVKQQLQAFSMACPLAKKYLETELGLAELFHLMLQEHHPNITREESFQVCLEVAGETMKILEAAQGKPPTEKNA